MEAGGSTRSCSRANYSGKHRRHGVNLQVITDPQSEIVCISRALLGRTHDLTAARTHRIIATCGRLGLPAGVDLAYLGAGGTFATPTRRPPCEEFTARQRSLNRVHTRLRYPVERGMATLKRCRIFRHARCRPNRLSSAAKAILTLQKQR
ncbi:transposase family protein [Actinacidiphila glaucinigra]|uniref:transposase family protein n=1 Tax=Actinacidiphila glaucinigra TaxID=235986 RepID=UPI0035E2A71D